MHVKVAAPNQGHLVNVTYSLGLGSKIILFLCHCKLEHKYKSVHLIFSFASDIVSHMIVAYMYIIVKYFVRQTMSGKLLELVIC